MSMQRVMDLIQANKKITKGEIVVFNGEEFEVPPMTEDEIEEMREDGREIAEIEVEIDGKKISLLDMDNGRKLFKRLQILPIPKEANMTAFWYLWRERQIEKGLADLPESKKEAIMKIIDSQ